MITQGHWRVPRDLMDEDAEANGLVVLCGSALIADCRNSLLPADEMRTNAEAVSRIPQMLMLLRLVEEYLAGRPNSDRTAAALYERAAHLLKGVET